MLSANLTIIAPIAGLARICAQPCRLCASVCRKSPAGAGLFLIDMVEWARVMKDAGTRENGSRSGRVRSHRPTGAEGAFAAKDRCSGGLHALI